MIIPPYFRLLSRKLGHRDLPRMPHTRVLVEDTCGLPYVGDDGFALPCRKGVLWFDHEGKLKEEWAIKNLRWGPYPFRDGYLAALGDRILFLSADGILDEVQVKANPTPPLIHGSSAYIATTLGHLYLIDEGWKEIDVRGAVFHQPVDMGDGIVVVGRGGIFNFSYGGVLRWMMNLEGVHFTAVDEWLIVITPKKVLLMDKEGRVYRRWKMKDGLYVSSLANGRAALITRKGFVYALNDFSDWHYVGRVTSPQSPPVPFHDNFIIGGADGSLYLLDPLMLSIKRWWGVAGSPIYMAVLNDHILVVSTRSVTLLGI